jgi:hypothetical protein
MNIVVHIKGADGDNQRALSVVGGKNIYSGDFHFST